MVANGGCNVGEDGFSMHNYCVICKVNSVTAPGMRCTRCMSPKAASAAGAAGDEPIIWVDVTGANSATYEFHNIPNEQAMRIVQDILPKVVELYMSKSRDYGGNVGDMIGLGPKATFVDIWRKVGKLKRVLWDGKTMVGEQADEILADLVGHVLLILDGMKREILG